MFRSKPLLLLTLGIMLAAAGCSSSRFHNSDGSLKARNYPVDGYMGITSANPNDPMNPTHHHYRDDSRLIRQVIAQIPGVQNSTVTFNGASARVNLELPERMADDEVYWIRDQAAQALSHNMPRYNIKVTTNRR